MKNIFKIKACSSGDRASDSDSESQGFDSLHAYELLVPGYFVSQVNGRQSPEPANVLKEYLNGIELWGCFGFDI